ncbi:MAG: sodium:solute symporter [Planctomycetota bacterium]|nr:sodium:solute symporter [Planctomycetaceae bacterium]MDQ3330098.1 sodium:solute symporter [Planctomycetota bacterium]
MNVSRAADLAVLVAYLCLTVGLGCWFGLRRRSTDDFMAGGHSLPGWAVGLSMFGSFVSSISFLANPGKSFAGDWNPFVFALSAPIAALIAVVWFVPFFRRTGTVSAYEHLEQRFGPWARTYAVICFLLLQVARMATIAYLLALAVAPFTGWRIETIIIITGAVMILYSIFGGIEAVVWIGVLQSGILLLGPLICIIALLAMVPGGLAGIIETGSEAGKFDLGNALPTSSAITGAGWAAIFNAQTFWIVLVYGLFVNLTNFGVDQSYVQRYVTTPDDRQAKRSVWITTLLYVPASAFFFFIGTALWVLSRQRSDFFPAGMAAEAPDQIFPFFIANGLPPGLGGLVVAAIFAAALDSNLSSMATLTLCDLYRRYFRDTKSDREAMWVLRFSTLGWGIVGTAAALAMTQAKSVLDVWWELAGICSGGMLGLFLLGRLAKRAGSAAGLIGVIAGVLTILWMSLSSKSDQGWWPTSLAAYGNPLHPFMTIVCGTLVIMFVGWLAAFVVPRRV